MRQSIGALLLGFALCAAGPAHAPTKFIGGPGLLASQAGLKPRVAMPGTNLSPATSWDQGTFVVDWSTYVARFSNGTVGLTYTRPVNGAQPRMDLQLRSVRAGLDVLFDGTTPAAPTVEESRRVVYRHGRFDEGYEPRSFGLEQWYRLPAPPADRGDLEIRCAIGTNQSAPPSGTSDGTLCFDVIRISDCTVIDANGQRLDLPMSYEAGDLVIRVPDAWLATATYPVLVDPLLGTSITADTAAADGWVYPVHTAYNATNNEYLITWNEFAAAGDADVFCRRVDAATGATIGGIISIETTINDSGPAVAGWRSDTNQYLIAYYDAPDTTTFTSAQIRGVILPGGSATPGAEFEINSDQPAADLNYDDYASVVGLTGKWRVVWMRYNAGLTDAGIFGRDVTSAGVFASASYTVQNLAADIEQNPRVAFNSTSGNTLIVWFRNTGTVYEVAGRTATTASPPVLGVATDISTVDTTPSTYVHVCAGTSATAEYLVCWQDEPTGDSNCRGRRVSTAGALLGTEIDIATTATFDGLPVPCYNSSADAYIVAWHSLTLAPPPGGVSAGDILGRAYAKAGMTVIENFTWGAAAAVDFWPNTASRTTVPEAIAGWWSGPTGGPYATLGQRYYVPIDPGLPTGLIQSDAPGGPNVPPVMTSADGIVAMRGTVPDANTNETVQLQVEIKLVTVAFDGTTNLFLGTSVAPGAVSEVTPPALAAGDYHWRARSVDSIGRQSAWVPFGGNPDAPLPAAIDFTISAAPPPPPPPPPPGGTGPRDNPNGNLGLNDYCSSGGAANGGFVWVALALSALLALAGARR